MTYEYRCVSCIECTILMNVWIEPDTEYILRQLVDGILCNFGLILLIFEATLKARFIIEVLELNLVHTSRVLYTDLYYIYSFILRWSLFKLLRLVLNLQPSYLSLASCIAILEKLISSVFIPGLSQVWTLLYASHHTTQQVSFFWRAGTLLEWWILLGSVCFAFSNNSL